MQEWTNFWQSHDTATSFACDYSVNDGPYGVVNQHWLNALKYINKDDVVVDLGAGNGALVKLYLDEYKELGCKRWLSTDIAKVNPAIKHDFVDFIEINANDMAFHDKSVNLFISMFGIEYADLAKVFDEIDRCLAVNGRYHFVLHKLDSMISSQTVLTLSVLKRFLQSSFWQSPVALLTKPSDEVKKILLQQLRIIYDEVDKDEKEDVQIIGHAVFHLCQSETSSAQLVKGLGILMSNLAAQEKRLKAQFASAKQTEKLLQLLEKSPLSCYKIDVLKHYNATIGWIVHNTHY